jgi:hypothetical protein
MRKLLLPLLALITTPLHAEDWRAKSTERDVVLKGFEFAEGGKQDVKFYIDGVRVAKDTTFDMSGYSAGLQPIVQLQKAANTNADVFEMDYIEIDGKRQ